MRTVTVTEAKNGLSALIDAVQGGETILIVDRGRPVARLEPVSGTGETDGRLSRLERSGVIRRNHLDPPLALISDPPPDLAGSSAVVALLRERREGR